MERCYHVFYRCWSFNIVWFWCLGIATPYVEKETTVSLQSHQPYQAHQGWIQGTPQMIGLSQLPVHANYPPYEPNTPNGDLHNPSSNTQHLATQCPTLSMWIRLMPTNKANFLFKNTQDFYQTTHAAPHWAIVFSDNIILDFHYQVFMLHLFKWSPNGTSWGVSYFRYFG